MGGAARKPANSLGEGKPVGYQTTTYGPAPGGKTGDMKHWEWTGSTWVKIDSGSFTGNGTIGTYQDPVTLNIGPISVEGKSGLSESLRWPADTLDDQSDWVFFQFGKYPKPFGRDVRRITAINDTKDKTERIAGWNAANLEEYNNSSAALGLEREEWGSDVQLKLFGKAVMLPVPQDVANEIQQTWQGKQFTAAGRAAVSALAAGNFSPANQVLKNIAGNFEALQVNSAPVMLPIPQDVANEIQQTWQGKQFTAVGRAAVAAAAAGKLHQAGEVVKNVKGNLFALQKSLTGLALNTLPGVGGNISFNDISGSTRGVVLNPNAELLYDSPQMREVGMVFKMVPRNPGESEAIYNICQTFRRNASPAFGGRDAEDKDWSFTVDSKYSQKTQGVIPGDRQNFIRVPNLCKFTFMKGRKAHPHLVQFKPCAISNVEVTYTPDGTFATYSDGAPVAVELRLSFMETKVVFAQEIKDFNPSGGSY